MDLVSLWLRLSSRFPILWLGCIGLILIPSLWVIVDAHSLEIVEWEQPSAGSSAQEMPLCDLKGQNRPFRPSFEKAAEQLEWSMDPERPDRTNEQKILTLRMKYAKEMRKVKPPCRIFVGFDSNGILKPTSSSDLFWIDASDSWFRMGAKDLNGNLVETDLIPMTFQETGMQAVSELPESSPFRLLGEAKWWGQDLFLPAFNPGAESQRIELGPKDRAEILDIKKTDWLIFNGESWEVGSVSESKRPLAIAHWTQKIGQSLELEGWEGDLYLRLRLDLASPAQIRKEELFSQLKIRSEKQVSCIIDQQYLILKPGDWVLKIDQRWRVLRKRDEKEAFLNGKLMGDLFLLDRIEIKNGAKRIVGRLFGPMRTQVIPIDSKPQEPQLRNRKNLRSKGSAERRSA